MNSTDTEWWNGRVIDGMPHQDYLNDPIPGGSLSSTGARMMLDPNCPAKFDYWRRHRRPPKLEFDLGTAAHKVLLGAGPELVVIDAENYKKGAPRIERDQAYMRHATPVLEHQMDMVEEMVAKVRGHRDAGRLVEPGSGRPEVVLSWRDVRVGIMLRSRLDWLSHKTLKDGRLIVVDYKTGRSAAPSKIEKAITDHGYHMQAAHNIDAVLGTGQAEDAAFFFIFQETEPPYLITVCELNPLTALWPARELNDKAREVFAKCNELNHWPAYAEDIIDIDLPPWEKQRMERIIGAHPIRGVA